MYNHKYTPQSKPNQDFIFGTRAVIEAIHAGKDIDKILIRKNLESDLSAELLGCLKGSLIPVQRVPVEKLNRITMKNHQGVIAFLSPITFQHLEDIIPTIYEEGATLLYCWTGDRCKKPGGYSSAPAMQPSASLGVPATHTAATNADAVKPAGALNTLTVCRKKPLREAIMP